MLKPNSPTLSITCANQIRYQQGRIILLGIIGCSLRFASLWIWNKFNFSYVNVAKIYYELIIFKTGWESWRVALSEPHNFISLVGPTFLNQTVVINRAKLVTFSSWFSFVNLFINVYKILHMIHQSTIYH